MPLYAYVKAPPKRLCLPNKKLGRLSKILSLTFFGMGLFLVGQAVLPILSWYLILLPGYDSGIISPLGSTFPAFVRATEVDQNKPTSWFIGLQDKPQGEVKTYSLTIPKLKITSARVELGGGNLNKALIAWPDSALPGNYGNNIIFGHSELPQFASTKSYAGMFTFLMDLAQGDEVFLDYDNIRYRYLVIDKYVVTPADLDVLEQRFDAAYVTLITCVPPGTVWKRGIVKARLTPKP